MAADLIRIIGIGNPLMGDDGLGIQAIEQLRKIDLPQHVELVDGGCGGLKLLPLFAGCRQLVLIDAADFGAAAGQIRVIGNQDLAQHSGVRAKLAGHQFGLLELLLLARKMGTLPELQIFAMQVASCQANSGLTAAVTAALPMLIDNIIKSLKNQ